MAMKFSELLQGYPNEQQAELFNSLGGQWPTLIGNPAYANTCAIRLSLAIGKAGLVIPSNVKEAIAGDGRPLIIKVKTMGDFLQSKFGDPWGMSKQPGIPATDKDLPTYSGIIVYHASWKDATGHFDLWDGKRFIGAGNFGDMADGFDIAMWRVD
jgi:hypothetical protein